MAETEDPIGDLAELAARVLDDYQPVSDLRPVVQAVLHEASAQLWIEKQLSETGLKSMEFRNGMTMELEPAQEMVAQWCGAARAMLGDAPNYSETPVSFPGERERSNKLEMEVKVAESPERFVFILQRVGPGKLTPHEARVKADAERDSVLRAVGKWAYDHANTSSVDVCALLQLLTEAGHTVPTREVL
jgi:hypothetical protein